MKALHIDVTYNGFSWTYIAWFIGFSGRTPSERSTLPSPTGFEGYADSSMEDIVDKSTT